MGKSAGKKFSKVYVPRELADLKIEDFVQTKSQELY
jgi:hypothetical protein